LNTKEEESYISDHIFATVAAANWPAAAARVMPPVF
jgi:hypothetical protein